MRIDLAAFSRLLARKIVQVSLAQTGVVTQLVQRADNGRMRCVGSSLALARTRGGAVCSGVLNNPVLRPEPADEDSMAIGMASNRPRITGIIQSSNGSDTA